MPQGLLRSNYGLNVTRHVRKQNNETFLIRSNTLSSREHHRLESFLLEIADRMPQGLLRLTYRGTVTRHVRQRNNGTLLNTFKHTCVKGAPYTAESEESEQREQRTNRRATK